MMNILKSKTMLFALALAVLGAVEANIGMLAPYMSPQVFGLFSVGVAVVVAALRIVTTVPLSAK